MSSSQIVGLVLTIATVWGFFAYSLHNDGTNRPYYCSWREAILKSGVGLFAFGVFALGVALLFGH